MYRITYNQGNGYRCGCCRRTSTETIDFSTEKEVIEWISELKACKIESRYEDDDDRSIEEIREIKDEDLTDRFNPDDKIVSGIVESRKKEKESKKEQEEKNRIESKKRQLAQLKKEFGE